MRIVLLDLEETVIDDWGSRNFLWSKIEKIEDFLQDDDKLGIFSWAVWDQQDVHKFQERIQATLEQSLRLTFAQDLLFSMKSISEIILQKRNKLISMDDMFDMFGKQECLLALLRCDFFPEGTEIILIDDVVEHQMTFTKDRRTIRFINVDSPRESW